MNFLLSKGNLKQHQAIHNNSPKGDNSRDSDSAKPDHEEAGDTQDSEHNHQDTELNMDNSKENGLKRSSPDSEDSLPPSKRPPGW